MVFDENKDKLLDVASIYLSFISTDYLHNKVIDQAGVIEGFLNVISNVFTISVDEMAWKFFNSTARLRVKYL